MNPVVFIIILLMTASGLGRMIRNRICSFSFPEDFIIDSSIGLALISYLVLGLNLLHLIRPPFPWLLLGLCAVSGFKGACYYGREIWKKLKTIRIKPELSFDFLLLLILIGNLLLIILTLFVPATAHDAVAYHLAVPKIYIQNQGFTETPFIVQSATPFHIEMLYLLSLWISSEYAAQIIHFIYLVFILGLLYSYSLKWCKNRSVSLLGSVLFLVNPFTIYFASTAYIDFAVAFYLITAGIYIIEWLKTGNASFLILSAVMSGISSAAKTTSLAYMLVLALIVFTAGLIQRKRFIRDTFVFSMIAGLICLPWYIKNWIVLGNPVWPYMYGLFQGKYLNPEFSERLLFKVRMYGFHGLKRFLTIFYDLVFSNRYGGALYNYGPLILSFLPGLVLIKKNRNLFYILGYIFISLVLFYFLTQQYRFMIHIVFFLMILTAWIFYSVNNGLIRTVFSIILVTNLVFFSMLNAGIRLNKVPCALGLETRSEYLAERIPEYQVYQYANHKLKKEDKIILFCGNAFYLDIPYFWGASLEQDMIRYDRPVEEIYKQLKEMKFTYLIHKKGQRPFKNFNILINKYFREEKTVKGYVLQKLI